MKIQRATFIGVQGVADVTIDLTDARTGAAHGLVIVSGPSGSGKTRMIEALIAAKEAIRPYGPMATGAAWIRSGQQAAKIQLTFHLDDEEREFAGAPSASIEAEVIFHADRVVGEADDGLRAVLGRYSHNPAHGKVDYFPAERRLPTFPPFPGVGPGEQRVSRLTRDQRKYGFILPFLRTLDHDAPRREKFAAALAALSPTLRYVRDESGEGIPRCFSSRGGDPATAAQLSSSEADAVVFAAEFACMGLERSLVFIDRPDLHVEEVEPFIAALTSIGRDNQLWLAGGARLAAGARGGYVLNLRA